MQISNSKYRYSNEIKTLIVKLILTLIFVSFINSLYSQNDTIFKKISLKNEIPKESQVILFQDSSFIVYTDFKSLNKIIKNNGNAALGKMYNDMIMEKSNDFYSKCSKPPAFILNILIDKEKCQIVNKKIKKAETIIVLKKYYIRLENSNILKIDYFSSAHFLFSYQQILK